MNGEHIWLSGIEPCVFGRHAGATFNRFCKLPVFRYPSGVNKIHDTQKPLPLIEELVEASSNRGDTILDPFSGSGTTGLACYNLGRRFIGYEIDPVYYDKATARLSDEMAQMRLEIW